MIFTRVISSPALIQSCSATRPLNTRGTPFWAWNGPLNRATLKRQVGVLKAMGMGGYHIPRAYRVDYPYLGDELHGLYPRRSGMGRARKNMLAWLYDEDRWPSASRAGCKRASCNTVPGICYSPLSPTGRARPVARSTAHRASRDVYGNGALLARYSVTLKNGYLDSYHLLDEGDTVPEGATTWHAYLETATPNPWYNNQTYVDTLNRKAIERFVSITHERYAEVVGSAFGSIIPAIFTDEPQFTHKTSLRFAEEQRDLVLPWTDDFSRLCPGLSPSPGAVPARGGLDLPGGKASLARYRYPRSRSGALRQAFAIPSAAWCNVLN